MNGQYLCNRAITVSYAYKKDTKGERHGTLAGVYSLHLTCLFIMSTFVLDFYLFLAGLDPAEVFTKCLNVIICQSRL